MRVRSGTGYKITILTISIFFLFISSGCKIDLLLGDIKTIVGESAIKASFSTSTTRLGEVPFSVTFTDESIGNIDTWEWDFDNDGTVDSTERSPVWSYTNPGLYDVSLKVSGGGFSDTVVRTSYIEAVGPLVADFSSDIDTGIDSVNVQFTDSSSGDITDWEWDFDNDDIVDSTLQNPSHTFTTGLYSVKLTVRNDTLGAAATEIKNDFIRVWDGIAADFSVSQATHELTDYNDTVTVTFTNESTGDVVSYDLDFGDGSPHFIPGSSWTTPKDHTYGKGVHTAELTAEDKLGGTSTQNKTITVNGPPAPPDSVTCQSISRSKIQVNWNDRSNDETGFRLEYRKTGTSTWLNLSPNPSQNQESATITGLETDTDYQIRVGAYNAYGNTQYSSVSTATTMPVWEIESKEIVQYEYVYDFELDPNDNPHILLFRISPSKVLYHLYKSGNTWYKETVAASDNLSGFFGFFIEDDGDIHFAYENNGTIYYRRKSSSGTWSTAETVATVSSLPYMDIAVTNPGSAEVPHVFYYDDSTKTIKNSYKQSGTWYKYDLQSHTDYYRYGWMSVKADIWNNKAVVAYYHTQHPNEDSTGYTSNAWAYISTQTLENNQISFGHTSIANLGNPPDSIPEPFGLHRIAIDRSGSTPVRHTLYKDYTSNGIHHSYCPGTTWISETVADSSNNLDQRSIAVDGNGNTCVTYYDSVNSKSYFRKYNGISWNTSEEISGGLNYLDTDSSGYINMIIQVSVTEIKYFIRNPE